MDYSDKQGSQSSVKTLLQLLRFLSIIERNHLLKIFFLLLWRPSWSFKNLLQPRQGFVRVLSTSANGSPAVYRLSPGWYCGSVAVK